MCGIVGFAGPGGISLLARMNDLLYHRGPDESGEFFDPSAGVHLAMRRLSIIDLSGGHQPMSNEDQSVWIVFNGEIYNHALLRTQLTAAGHRFRSDHSDTEVLVHLYEEEGEGMVERLNGMFAFVLYDKRKKRFFGARDRAGIKPLYYHRAPGFFAFASELKALLVTPSVSKKLDLQSVSDYLSFQCVPAPRSILQDVQKLPPAHLFSYSLDTKDFSSRRYWQAPCAVNCPAATTEEIVPLVREQFTSAVLRWTMSDVPIACALSGGIDSSGIVGILSQAGIGSLHTFTLGFGSAEGTALDERALARATARRWKTEHHEITIRPRDLLNDLDHMIWHLDEPYGGGLPSWYVFKSMKGIVKVGVTGTGGDELFGNYGKWLRYERTASRLRETARVALLDAAPGASARALRAFPQGYLYHRYFTEVMKRRMLFAPGEFDGIIPSERMIQDRFDAAAGRPARDTVAAIDFSLQLPEEFLHMTDRFSMAHSIEARTPFLDHEFVQTILALPAAVRTRPGALKGLFHQALANTLDPELINAPKRGFILPIDHWLRHELSGQVSEYLGKNYLRRQGLFREDLAGSLITPYRCGARYLKDFIWTVLMFQLWYRRFLE